MHQILGCKQPVHSALQGGISLGSAKTVFRVCPVKLQIPLIDVKLPFRPVIPHLKRIQQGRRFSISPCLHPAQVVVRKIRKFIG